MINLLLDDGQTKTSQQLSEVQQEMRKVCEPLKVIQPDYSWHRTENENHFKQNFSALKLAWDAELINQLGFYIPPMVDVYYKDHADRVYDFAFDKFRYSGWYYHPHFERVPYIQNSKGWWSEQSYAGNGLGLLGRRSIPEGRVDYVDIGKYQGQMPTDAMAKYRYLKATLVPQPDRYWIASPEFRPRREGILSILDTILRDTLDPWLVLSFGNWFVAVCEWV